MLETVINFFLELSASWGYWGIFFLMTVESSFIPFPSEIVIPPAAYLAAQGEMNIYLVVVMGILGSLVGAVINYVLARWLGRPIIYSLVEKKWTSFLLLNRKKLDKAEEGFRDYGGISTFLGRLVPAVRQLISIPAGFAEMKFGKFLFFTFLGAGFWVIVLAALGWFFGSNEAVLQNYYSELTWGVVGVVFVIILVVLYRKKRK